MYFRTCARTVICAKICNVFQRNGDAMEKTIVEMVQTKLIAVRNSIIVCFWFFIKSIWKSVLFLFLDLHLIEPEHCKIGDRKFLCHDHKKCITIDNVCNENVDCLDGSDEGGLCNNVTGNYIIYPTKILVTSRS